MKPPFAPTAIFFAILALFCLLFGGCATFKARTKYHTAAISAPSVAPVKSSIASASASSAETSRHISDIRKGTDIVDRKANRALQFFP